MKHYKSVFTDEIELLYALYDLHNKGEIIELDPMFFKGNFYKNTGELPKYYSDINPQFEWIKKVDATNTDFKDNSINSMILDPPFMFGNRKSQKEFYSSRTHGILTEKEILKLYDDLFKEANRILINKGLLIFKCQDYTDTKTTLMHCIVYNLAIKYGFKVEDLAILVKPNKIYNPKVKQRHLRKIHTYFFIFRKSI